jgi:hypothetical protein
MHFDYTLYFVGGMLRAPVFRRSEGSRTNYDRIALSSEDESPLCTFRRSEADPDRGLSVG